MVPPAGTAEGSPQWMLWFRNIPAGLPFTANSTLVDYSLQMASGESDAPIRNTGIFPLLSLHTLRPIHRMRPAAEFAKFVRNLQVQVPA